MTHRTILLLVRLAVAPPAMLAQTADVRGVVTDSVTGAPLGGVRVTWSAKASTRTITAFTNDQGRFTTTRLPHGSYAVAFSRVGYHPRRLEDVEVTAGRPTLSIALAARGIVLDPIVVSVSREEQAWLDAPAAVSVIERSGIKDDIHLSPLEQIRTLPGVDLASKGLVQHSFEVRGPRAPLSGALLMLTDYRYAEVPSLGLNVPYLVPSTRQDVERIELALGPAAALYGPGAARGVLHVVTRSPFESPGGVVSVTGGERSIVQGAFRYAAILHPRLAFALSGDYVRGDDWRHVDSVETANRATAITKGANPDTLLIARRDYAVARAGGEARLDWRPGPSTEIVAKSGVAEAIDNIDLTTSGAVQLRHWRSSYVQTWLRSGHLFANAMYNVNDAGDTYFLRTGAPVVDQSRVVAAQIQHGGRVELVDLIYGSDLRWTDPRTAGTVHGQYEDDDRLTETGAYLQATAPLNPRLHLITALRVDHHSRLNDVVLSPRAGMVFKLGPTQALRLTYNRAFSSPQPGDLFQDFRLGGLRSPGGYSIRAEGIPQHGFSFRRDCNGLCMRSPFNPAGADGYLPADATQFWPAVVTLLQQQGVDLADVPAPSAVQVGTGLAALDRAAGTFVPVAPADVQDVEPLRREITNALELGYKGKLRGRIAFDTDLWVTRVRDRMLARPASITPNVFFDQATLEQYLSGFRSAAEASALAAQISQLPVGTVSPQETLHPVDLLFAERQGQTYTLWGIDLAMDVALTSELSVAGTYSWVSNDSIAGDTPDTPVVPNIPRNKGSVRVTYNEHAGGLTAAVQARALSAFRLSRGLVATYHDSRIAGYAVMDLEAAYSIGPDRKVTVSADVQNVLNHGHREIAGAPALGRLSLLAVRMEF
jgi:outer membrane receptor for ferrienterochelin and colicins